jgi:hypothetical protein
MQIWLNQAQHRERLAAAEAARRRRASWVTRPDPISRLARATWTWFNNVAHGRREAALICGEWEIWQRALDPDIEAREQEAVEASENV